MLTRNDQDNPDLGATCLGSQLAVHTLLPTRQQQPIAPGNAIRSSSWAAALGAVLLHSRSVPSQTVTGAVVCAGLLHGGFHFKGD